MSFKVIPHELLENLSSPHWKDELAISFGAFSLNYKKQQTQAVPQPQWEKTKKDSLSAPPTRGREQTVSSL